MPKPNTITQAKAKRIFSAMVAAGMTPEKVEIHADKVVVAVSKQNKSVQFDLEDPDINWAKSPFPDSLS